MRLRFIYYIYRFGILNGIYLYFKILSGSVNKIKLPKIKHPFTLRANTSDIPTFQQIFLKHEYEIPVTGNPKVIIDGGSNVGLFAIQYLNKFPEARIFCIEPDTENFELLKKNLSSYKNVVLENCGLWHKDTKLKVYDKYNLGKWGIVVEEDPQSGSINALSIGSLLKKYSIETIDILKLDVETSEKQIFSANYEEWLPKVKMIIIELHDRIEKGCSKSFFTAINKSFNNYSFDYKGESTIIINEDLN